MKSATKTMGTDIHLFVEAAYDGIGDRWESLCNDYNFGRDYILFGIMAQIRTEHIGGFERKGVPFNASTHTIKRYNGGGYHSPSWLTLEELWKVRHLYHEYRCRLDHFKSSYAPLDALMAMMTEFEEAGVKTRIVFFFDS